MVKNFALAIGAALLLSTPAMGFRHLNTTVDVKKDRHKLVEKVDLKKNAASQAEKQDLSVPTRAGKITDVIEYAEGETVTYVKSSGGYYLFWGIIPLEYNGTSPSSVVFGDNGDVYFYNIMSMGATDTYVKGTIEGDKIVLPLPQTVIFYESEGYGYNLDVLKVSADGSTFETAGIESVEFSFNPETMEMGLVLPGDDYALGFVYTNNDGWVGYCDFYQTYEMLTEEANSVPDGVNLATWVYSDAKGSHEMEVGITEDKIYLVGLDTSMPDCVVIADLDGDKATISQNQYVGLYADQYYVYTKLVYGYLDSAGYEDYDLAPGDIVYELNVDLGNKVISSAPDQEYKLCLNASKDYIFYVGVYSDFKISFQSLFAGTPSNPYGLSVNDYYDYFGSYDFSFFISNTSTDGNMLLYDDMYYQIFVDGKVMEFEEKDGMYPGVESIMTEIPFNFLNGSDIYSNLGESNRVVSLYMQGMKSVGVQAIYKYGGDVTYSEIITLNLAESGVNNIESSNIVDSTYYDLNGRPVTNPDKGIYVIRETLSNGNTVTRKVVRK